MRHKARLYNVILPIWLLVLFPQVWLLVLPANLLIDCGVLFITLRVLQCSHRRDVLKKVWWKIWLLGFAADGIGVLWMILGLIPSASNLPFRELWENTVGHITHNPFIHPAAFLWTLAGVAVAGVCVTLFDRRVFRRCGLLSEADAGRAALIMGVVTAPWLFFIPMY